MNVVARSVKVLWSNQGAGFRIARILVLLSAGIVVLVMTFENKLIFFPSKYPQGQWSPDITFAREGEVVPAIEDCWFNTSDKLKLHGWLCTPQRRVGGQFKQVTADMTLLWFHGNAGNLSHRYDMICALMELPVNVFIIDYRGYGRSEGYPSEEGLYLDARAAWDYLTGERATDSRNIIIFGKSLGGVPAIDLASKVSPAGLIVQSSFSSATDVAAAILPFFPRLLLRTKMDSISKIKKVRCPKLFIHSPADEVIPYELGRRLYEDAPEPKQFYDVERAPHNETYIVGGKTYLDALRRFVRSCAPS